MSATTRRALFGAGFAVAAASAVPFAAMAASSAPRLTDDQIKLASWLHSGWREKGLDVAVVVINAGFGYEDVELAGYDSPDRATRRLTVYVTDGERTRAFKASGERKARVSL